jgi:DeoR/GlpR family transcriptional regulator of sugar metabolism
MRQALASDNEVFVSRLARQLSVSEMTIRRDIRVLESKGEVIRTHGGAALAKRLTFEFTFRNQQNNNQANKTAIGARAVKEVKDGDIIMLDTGTTTLEIARQLKTKKNITIITTSLAIVSELQFSPDIKVVLLGGYLRSGSPDMCGPLTEDNIKRFRADIAFVGADGVDAGGNTFTNSIEVANLSREMAKNSSKVIVVSDSSKVGKSSLVKMMSPGDYDLMITDKHIQSKLLRKLKKKVNVKQAS